MKYKYLFIKADSWGTSYVYKILQYHGDGTISVSFIGLRRILECRIYADGSIIRVNYPFDYIMNQWIFANGDEIEFDTGI